MTVFRKQSILFELIQIKHRAGVLAIRVYNMQLLSTFEPNYWSVTEITLYLRDLLESDANLHDVWVHGEVSNVSRPQSGHLYFTLKDRSSALRCVMWKNNVNQQQFIPRDGQSIEAHGSISLYETQGQYQLYTDLIRPLGEGALYQEFLRLKAELELEGLFSPERKRSIPKIPQHLGIITSPTGAALKDILHTLQRRYPLVKVTLAPSLVQGAGASENIARAIHDLNHFAKPDVIILARGGGSIEDLWAFNDKEVAYAIAESDAPVVTGIGHETDFTIADFVADLRAPTPTAAAELATPNRDELILDLSEIGQNISKIIQRIVESKRWQVTYLSDRIKLRSPSAKINSNQQRLDEISQKNLFISTQYFRERRANLDSIKKQISSLNPQSILKRGYSVIKKFDGQIVRSVKSVAQGENLTAILSDGYLRVQIEEVVDRKDESS